MRSAVAIPMILALLLGAPALAGDLVQEDTGISFPETITLPAAGGEATLRATGVSLREATFMKVNVYAVVSYIDASVELGDDPAAAIISADAPRCIDMRFVRDVSADKITGAYREGIEKNFKEEEIAALAPALDRFLALFTADVAEGDRMELIYLPGTGVEARLNGETLGTEPGEPLARALWTIWFGRKPVSKSMKKELVSRVS